jgi:hypothetical protein
VLNWIESDWKINIFYYNRQLTIDSQHNTVAITCEFVLPTRGTKDLCFISELLVQDVSNGKKVDHLRAENKFSEVV